MSQADSRITSIAQTTQGACPANSDGLHQLHYDAYLSAMAAYRAMHINASDDAMDAASALVAEKFDDLMECPPDTLRAVLLKLRAAQHQAVQTTESSAVSPRVYGELLSIIAADLELVMHIVKAEG